jgi:hypothetical protein
VAGSGGFFSFDIAGTGTLHHDDANAAADSSDSPQVTEGAPPIYAHLSWLAGLALGILFIGLIVLFRSSPVQSRS